MSDESMPPPLGDEARAFLDAHLFEPDRSALERVRARVVAPRKRSRIPPELIAVAAVVLAIASVQAVWLVAHRHSPVTAQSVVETYRSGDIALAQRMAAECQGAGCDQITVTGLARLDELESRRDALTPAEETQLRRLQGVWLPPELSSQAWSARVHSLRTAGRIDEALDLAEWCTQSQAVTHECIRSLATLRAQIATRDRDPAMLKKARSASEWYLRVTPADDAHREPIKTILGLADDHFDARLTLKVGTHGHVSFDAITSLSVGNEKVVTGLVEPGGLGVDLTGVAVGKTTLSIVTREGDTRITEVLVVP